MPANEVGAVLIADADSEARSALADTIRPMVAELWLASSGTDALETLASRPVTLLFLDLRLPDIDGLALLEKLEREHSRVRVFVMVDGPDVESAEAMRHGAAGILSKPVSLDDALDVLSRDPHDFENMGP